MRLCPCAPLKQSSLFPFVNRSAAFGCFRVLPSLRTQHVSCDAAHTCVHVGTTTRTRSATSRRSTRAAPRATWPPTPPTVSEPGQHKTKDVCRTIRHRGRARRPAGRAGKGAHRLARRRDRTPCRLMGFARRSRISIGIAQKCQPIGTCMTPDSCQHLTISACWHESDPIHMFMGLNCLGSSSYLELAVLAARFGTQRESWPMSIRCTR